MSVRILSSAALALSLVVPARVLQAAGTRSPIAPATSVQGAAPPAPSAGAARAQPGSQLTIYLVTAGQGNQIWEKFGHSAIWIHDAATDQDIAYNWGLFDFAQPGFIRRFLRGQMLYWMAGLDAQAMIQQYIAANRSVWVQRLHLSPAQRESLREFVEWNERPENRYYRYDYYRDNCSTRVRDAIDRVLGGQIRAATDTIGTGTSYRWHTRRLMTEEIAAYTGIELGLGHPADREITSWAEMFLPVSMHNAFARMRVRDSATGELVPLVESDREVFRATRSPEPTAPPRWLVRYLVAGILLGVIFALLGRGVGAGSRPARWGLAVLAAAWSFVVGVLGIALILLWTVTDHVFARWNENVLQATPLSLALVVLIPLALYRQQDGIAARRVALLIAGLSIVGLLIKVLPWFDQVNYESMALLLPAHVGLAVALLLVASGRDRARYAMSGVQSTGGA